MTWPQVFIAASLLANATFGISKTVRSKSLGSVSATLLVFYSVAWTTCYALVLRAGGFW